MAKTCKDWFRKEGKNPQSIHEYKKNMYQLSFLIKTLEFITGFFTVLHIFNSIQNVFFPIHLSAYQVPQSLPQ